MGNKNLSRRDFIKKTTNISLTGLILSQSALSSKDDISHTSAASSVAGTIKHLGKLNTKTFLNPGTEYRGVPFLFFNDKIDGKEAARQVRAMRHAGWGRVLPRRYSGLLDASYGKGWNNAVHEVVKMSKQLDMKVFLQEADKNGWYSAAPTQIPGMKDEYRNKCIVKRRADQEPGRHETLITRSGDYTYYQHTAYPVSGWENSFCWLDLLDEDTVHSYFTALFNFLHNEFGNEFGKTIEAMWVAEPHITMGKPKGVDSLPWTPKLPEIFEKEWGYPLIENIPKLFNDIGDFQKIRYHYWRTLGNLMAECYSRLMGEYCKKNNLKFTGHLMGEDTFLSQLQYSVNVMPLLEYMDIPGIDHLTIDLHWPTGDAFILTPKQAFSVANQLGKKEVLAEMYGTSDAGCSFEDRKRVFQWLAVLGINYRNYHGAFYSLRGRRKRFYPPNINLQHPYWSENRVVADFCARLSYVLRQGQYKADVLVINSIESYYLKGKIEKKLTKRVGPLDQDIINLSHNLLKIQRGFDYGDETLISKYGKIADNNFVIGEMSYKVVILPYIKVLRSTTVKLLIEFLDAGGIIISVGKLPAMIDGEINKNISVLNKKVIQISNEPEALRAKLNEFVSPDVQIKSLNGKPAETIWVQQRTLENANLYFLTNTSSNAIIETEVLFEGNGKLESWNLENGRIECVPQQKKAEHIKTKLEFVPGGSYLLILNKKAVPTNIPPKTGKIAKRIPLKTFQIKRDDPNSMTLDFCRFRKGQGSWSQILPIQGIQSILTREKYYGPATLRFEFKSEIKPNKCAVVIEEADKYIIMVNGSTVKYEGLPFYRDKCFLPVNITQYVKPGANYVDITRDFETADKENLDNENLFKFYGTELEQIYLIGDFAVKGEKIGQDFFETKRHRYKSKFILTKESGITSGDLLADGYCFFNGKINLTTEAIISKIKENERYYFNIENLFTTIAKIKINNQDAGIIAWRPYRLDITDYIWEGQNWIEISLINSLRNLLGGIHFIPSKNMPGGQWSQKANPRIGDGSEWYKNREKNKYWSDDYFFRPLGVGNTVITCENYG